VKEFGYVVSSARSGYVSDDSDNGYDHLHGDVSV